MTDSKHYRRARISGLPKTRMAPEQWMDFLKPLSMAIGVPAGV